MLSSSLLILNRDINMSVFMGRPGISNPYDGLPTTPLDVKLGRNIEFEVVTTRDEEIDPPTILSKGLWIYRIAILLREVSKLEGDGQHPRDWARVIKLHRDILDLDSSKPAVFRLENPDTRWDHSPDLRWLKGIRYYLAQMHHFCLMALHRRYMFHRLQSRNETMASSLMMLQLHEGMLSSFPDSSWRK